jgi:hypothetical protein
MYDSDNWILNIYTNKYESTINNNKSNKNKDFKYQDEYIDYNGKV